MKLLFTPDWLRRRIEAEPDGMSCEAGPPEQAGFKAGDLVEKIDGYKWPGVILASFSTTKGKHRLVVECLVPEVAGALHIYSPEQLRHADEQYAPAAKEE